MAKLAYFCVTSKFLTLKVQIIFSILHFESSYSHVMCIALTPVGNADIKDCS